MSHLCWRAAAAFGAVVALVACFGGHALADDFQKSIQALEWRCVGPHVGNRGCTVAMHPTDKNKFFHGHSSGGLWMTEDAGQYWIPISDNDFAVGSIGAMAISPSHPDIIYVGTGEPQLRDCVSWGDGMYKSTDGGQTWTHIGLKNSRNISRVRVHPTNPNLVYVSVIGNAFGPSKDRGVYRSEDGGKNWRQITNPLEIKKLTLYKIVALDSTVWVVGQKGNYFYSEDGGISWKNPEDGTNTKFWLRDMAFSDAGTGWAVGSRGTIIKTEDGGKSWKMLSGIPVSLGQ